MGIHRCSVHKTLTQPPPIIAVIQPSGPKLAWRPFTDTKAVIASSARSTIAASAKPLPQRDRGSTRMRKRSGGRRGLVM